MEKRVFIVHGWEGKPEGDWLPWLKSELEKENVKTVIPKMPDTDAPKMDAWIPYLSECVEKADKNTYFVGHSIGGQAVLRYIEGLNAKEKVGGVLLVASWVSLNLESAEDKEIAKPWIETPIGWERILSHTSNFTAIFSDNDPYVPLGNASIFKERLGAKILIEHGKGHINEEAGIKRLDSIRDELLLLMKR